MMKKILVICLLLLSQQAYAKEPPQWLLDALKVDNPNQLAVLVWVDEDCTPTKEEVKESVTGVLIRSRVRPLMGDEYWTAPLHLSVGLRCIKYDSAYQIFETTIFFGNASKRPVVFFAVPYFAFGISDKAGMVTEIKNQVEAAITDFIKANFDL